MIKIIRTDHKSYQNYEIRNYFCLINDIREWNDTKKECEEFENKHTPRFGTINIFLFTSIWAAEQVDYRQLSGKDYIRYADEHPFAILNHILMPDPMHGDELNLIKKNSEKYGDMLFEDIIYYIYKERIKDNPEQLHKFIIYDNEIQNSEARK